MSITTDTFCFNQTSIFWRILREYSKRQFAVGVSFLWWYRCKTFKFNECSTAH
uniref:Uncharacterized protein n=2 Tax=Parascaris univalens TaxID=6257 RepID=A0A914ZEW9_PARUN